MEDQTFDSDSSPELEPEQGALLEDSPASDVEDAERGSLEDAIREALADQVEDEDEPAEEIAAEAPNTDSSSEVDQPEQEAEAGPQDDEQLMKLLEEMKSDVPLGKINRFREILNERNQYQEQNNNLLKVEEHFRTLQDSARAGGMSEQQISQYFELPMLMQSNPAAAYELIKGFESEMADKYGMTMPADLQQKVEEGYVDQETAERLSRAEAQTRMQLQQNEVQQAQRHEQARMATAQAVSSAVTSYEQQLQNSDPDYSAKKEWLYEKLQARKLSQGNPESPEQAIQWVNEAMAGINETLGKVAPKPVAKRPIQSRGVNQPTSAPPASMYDAVLRAVGGTVGE